MSEITDAELVQLTLEAGEGDFRPFEELVKRYQGQIVANCRHLTRDPALAEDLAQEVFVKVFFSLRRLQETAAFRSWMKRIKVNHCLNHLKKVEGRTFVDIEEEGFRGHEALLDDPSVERKLLAESLEAQVHAILDSLSPTLRIPLVLRDMDEFSYAEISELLGIGVSATKMRIMRGRQEFRAQFEALKREQTLETED